LLAPFRQSGAHYVPRATVWSIAPADDGDPAQHELGISIDGTAHLTRARAIILATGAQERPFPIPGWTLPGVIGAGAAQILFKTSALAPSGRTVLAGSGPLLYLLAWQLLQAGVRIGTLLDTTPGGRLTAAWRDAFRFLTSAYFVKGARLVRDVRSAVNVVRRVDALSAHGVERLERVRFSANGMTRDLPADLLLLHQGVVPNINLSNAAGCEHEWDALLHCFRPRLDGWGASSVPGLWIAGDSGGIQGARAAEHRGRIAAVAVANVLGRIDDAQREAQALLHRRSLARELAGRRFLDVLFEPPRAFRVPGDETIVCRCEEVTAGQVREAVKLGCPGPNQMKAFLRCGMGPCQGRMCGLTVVDIIADARGVSPADVGYYRLRFPTKPITLGELATLPQTEASKAAVVRLRK
jgi:NADPH-dependent 2,4-dienoyl-CoA reductase/sulfur reductase-like enzyme